MGTDTYMVCALTFTEADGVERLCGEVVWAGSDDRAGAEHLRRAAADGLITRLTEPKGAGSA
jgi:hypothetical protein